MNDQRLIQENKILDTGVKLDARIGLTNTLDLYTGYQFNEVGVSNLEDINNPIYRRFIKKVLRNHALFAEGNYSSKSNKTNLRVGLRANYFEKFNRFILEPRLAFNQQFLDHFSFELLGEMKSQTTTQVIDLQNDFLGVKKGDGYWLMKMTFPLLRAGSFLSACVTRKGVFYLVWIPILNK